MSWLSTLFDNNRNFVGNATKNFAPLLALTPAGWLGAGLAGAVGQGIRKGSNLGDIVRSGVDAGSVGGSLQGLAGAGAKAGLMGGEQGALGTMARQGSGVGTMRGMFAPGSQAVGGSAPMPQVPAPMSAPSPAMPVYGTGLGTGISPEAVTSMTPRVGPGIQTGMSTLNPSMAPGLPDISRLAPATAFAIPNAALQATQTFRNGNVSGLPWYKQLGASAMNDPITALRVTGGIAGLPGEMRKNDAEAELLKQQAEAAGMTVDQMRQQKANMDALRNALTARYNAR